jgi:hypothetical protein
VELRSSLVSNAGPPAGIGLEDNDGDEEENNCFQMASINFQYLTCIVFKVAIDLLLLRIIESVSNISMLLTTTYRYSHIIMLYSIQLPLEGFHLIFLHNSCSSLVGTHSLNSVIPL